MQAMSKSTSQETFPNPVDPARLHGVYKNPKGSGATAYILTARSVGGAPLNVLVDPPYYSSRLGDQLQEVGGVQLFLMSHRHTVVDHNRWKARFPDMVRVMHRDEMTYGESGVEKQLEGEGPWELAPGLTAVHTPGHTPGSVCFLAEAAFTGAQEGALFTGDHLGFDQYLGRLDGFARYGQDTPLQAESMSKLADLPFAWLLPDHGRGVHFQSRDERRESLLRCAKEFKEDPHGSGGQGYAWAKQLHLA